MQKVSAAEGIDFLEDSLPDGYGRYLMHKVLLKQGINDLNLSALERLSFVGNGGMGALEYYPQTPFDKDGEVADFDALQEGHWLVKFRHTYDPQDMGTQDAGAVEEMYRRMVFNYLMDNKDDHCKNFSFICLKNPRGEWIWKLAPAYDLTLCTEGYNGEHATSVNGTGHPKLEDFIKLGTDIRMTRERCIELIRQVEDGCRRKLK